jgi:hypothetical protein
MSKKIAFSGLILIICVVALLLLPTPSSIESTTHSIEITEVNNTYQVKEHIIIDGTLLTNSSQYQFYLPPSAESDDLKVVIDNTQLSEPQHTDSIYSFEVNNSTYVQEIVTIDLTYYLPINTVFFEKTFLEQSSDSADGGR